MYPNVRGSKIAADIKKSLNERYYILKINNIEMMGEVQIANHMHHQVAHI